MKLRLLDFSFDSKDNISEKGMFLMETGSQVGGNDKKDSISPITIVLVGAGNRAHVYSSYGKQHPDELQVVGVVEPNKIRREDAAKRFNLPEKNCFDSVDEFVKYPLMADAAINGTMDEIHEQTSIPLLKAGYHVLLEKPIGTSEQEEIGSAHV